MKDLTGQIFGRLTVQHPTAFRRNGSVVWQCRCACGKFALVASKYLASGSTRSCGCLHIESVRANGTHRGRTLARAIFADRAKKLFRGGTQAKHRKAGQTVAVKAFLKKLEGGEA